jgi:dTDP-glucose pyrophosphorylase
MEMASYSTIITAAGPVDQTYLDFYPGTPKNLVQHEGVPILSRAVTSYTAPQASAVNIAIRRDEDEQFSTRAAIQALHPGTSFSLVHSNLQGALVTALIASSFLPSKSPLVIAGGDSEISGGIHSLIESFLQEGFTAGTIVFESNDPRWSYIRTGKDGAVIQVSEKKVTGKLATTGVFFFDSVETFWASTKWCLVNNAQIGGNYFVSTALNSIIANGARVGYTEIDRSMYRNHKLATELE